MGLKNRILRRDSDPATPVDADGTAESAEAEAVEPATTSLLSEPEPSQPAVADSPTEGDTMVFTPGAEEPVAAVPEPAVDPTPEPAVDPTPEAAVDASPAQGLAPLPPRRPGFRERGQLRRRLRFLREARELGFRDLGGLVFDQHRFQRPNEGLVQGKVAAIDAADRELRMIEDVLALRRPYEELFVAGVSACPRCGALHGSDARFCPQCGLAFSGPRQVAGVWTGEGAAQPGTGASPGQSALFDPQAPRTEAPAPPA